MHISFEYIFAALVLFVMIGSSINTLLPVAQVYITEAQQMRLEQEAARMLDKILLSSGKPPDWGANLRINVSAIGELRDFGLSRQGSEGRYVLDADKLARLANGSQASGVSNYYFLSHEAGRQLLRVQAKYGFRISFLPALDLCVRLPEQGTNVTVQVTGDSGARVADVNLTATVIWIPQGSGLLASGTVNGRSDWQGLCELEFGGSGPNGSDPVFSQAAVVVSADYCGVKTAVVATGPTVCGATVLGDRVQIPTSSVDEIIVILQGPVLVVAPCLLESTTTAARTIESGSASWLEVQLFSMDPFTQAVVLVAQRGGNETLVVAPRPRLFSYGRTQVQPLHAVTLRRLVTVNGLTHRVELTVWRMSE